MDCIRFHLGIGWLSPFARFQIKNLDHHYLTLNYGHAYGALQFNQS
ncbi:hypothetical protein LINGRAHAP2_LOCUS30336 [Linum grandiflorum]